MISTTTISSIEREAVARRACARDTHDGRSARSRHLSPSRAIIACDRARMSRRRPVGPPPHRRPSASAYRLRRLHSADRVDAAVASRRSRRTFRRSAVEFVCDAEARSRRARSDELDLMWPSTPRRSQPRRLPGRPPSTSTSSDGSMASAGRGVEAGVRVTVREERLRGGEPVPQVRLCSPVLGPLTGAEEGRQSDGDQDADDQNDHHQLDEGEALVVLPALPEAFEHGVTSLS